MGEVGATSVEPEHGGPDGPVGDIVLLPKQVQVVPTFDQTMFKCSVKGAKIDIGGCLEITLTVPPDQKYAAISLTDAAGLMIEVAARRLRRGGQIHG